MEMSDALDKGMERLKTWESNSAWMISGWAIIPSSNPGKYLLRSKTGRQPGHPICPAMSVPRILSPASLRMSNSLNCRTVAEFVETKEQRDMPFR